MNENMMFVIGKLNFVSYQFIFRCVTPLDPRSPLEYKMLLHIYATYVKGILGLVGGNRVVKAEYVI